MGDSLLRRIMRQPIGRFALTLLVLAAGTGACEKAGNPTDGTRPERITDLRVSAVAESTVTLTWTAPGDDVMSGTASGYELRVFDGKPSEQDWTAGTVVGPLPAPQAPGTREYYTATGLTPGRQIYFALKTQDDASLWSLMSNDRSAVPGTPSCRISPDSLAFGMTAVGGSFDLPVVIENTGGGTLEGEIAFPCPDFSLASETPSWHLFGGQSIRLTLRFTPAGAGFRSCALPLGASCGPLPVSGSGGTLALAVTPVFFDSTRFAMGSPADEPGREPDEKQHTVVLTFPYSVGTREVIQSDWVALMGWNDSRFPGADRPVEHVTWFDCLEFCNRLSTLKGVTPVYTLREVEKQGVHIVSAAVGWNTRADGYRLPTEAEWERACRAGTTTPFSNGDITNLDCADPVLDAAAWYCGNAGQSSQPSQQKRPNPLGLYDAHGNVFEWCWDFYEPNYGQTLENPDDPLRTAQDPMGPAEGESRVVRGGSFSSSAKQCRSAYRLYHRPGLLLDDVGLRVVRGR